MHSSDEQLICDGRRTEVGIYKRKQESKNERKHALDQESDQEKGTKTGSRPRNKI